jgi:hypothetical protein
MKVSILEQTRHRENATDGWGSLDGFWWIVAFSDFTVAQTPNQLA